MGKTIKKVHARPKKKIPKNPKITKWASGSKTYPGYCHNYKHFGYMTIDCMCKHKCLDKKCVFFEKREDHNFWWDRNYSTNRVNYKNLQKMKSHVDYDDPKAIAMRAKFEESKTEEMNNSDIALDA